jgi:hypothetical protein
MTFRTRLGLPHPLIVGIFWCVCTHPINVTSVHLLCCASGNECMGTHDAIQDTFAAITRDDDFHVGWKQLCFFQPRSIPLIDELTLCSPKMKFAH